MNPAPSVILFTTLSGMGFGFLALLGLGLVPGAGWGAFFHWAFGYGLAIAGLVSSTFHLGHPERAWRAFSQWRSSWLSREGVAAVVTLAILAPQAMSDWLGLGWGQLCGIIGAIGCGATVLSTAMIYAQLKTVPRWNHWITPATYLVFAVMGGAILAAGGVWVVLLAALLAGLMIYGWRRGDAAFGRAGVGLASATGLTALGQPSVFEQAHTAGNYLLHEMMFTVGRRHVARLRAIAIGLGCVLPAVTALTLPAVWAIAIGAGAHLLGALAHRWLFFAQAEHVVGLYYGKV